MGMGFLTVVLFSVPVWLIIWTATAELTVEEASVVLRDRGYSDIRVGSDSDRSQCPYIGRHRAALVRHFTATSLEGFNVRGVVCADIGEQYVAVEETFRRR